MLYSIRVNTKDAAPALRVAWRPPRGNDAKHQTRHRFMCPRCLHPDDLEPLCMRCRSHP